MQLQTINGRYGECTFICGDEYLGRSVFSYGEYNKEECEHIVALAKLREGGIVLDIGANIGNVSQALEYSGETVIAFEPQPAIYECLQKNIIGKTYNIAVGAVEGTAHMPKADYSKKGNFGGIGIVNTFDVYNTITVPVKTIDSFNFQDVKLMKIDVEGFEENVLRGAIETIARCKPVLYVEADRREKVNSLMTYIISLGYSIKPHQPPLFSPDNYFKNPKNIWGKNFVSLNWECHYVNDK